MIFEVSEGLAGPPGASPGLPGAGPQLYSFDEKGWGTTRGPAAALRGPLAISDSRILPLGLGPETFETRPRRAGFQPSGPGETLVFPWRGRRLQSRVGGPGEGPVLEPLGCPGERSY